MYLFCIVLPLLFLPSSNSGQNIFRKPFGTSSDSLTFASRRNGFRAGIPSLPQTDAGVTLPVTHRILQPSCAAFCQFIDRYIYGVCPIFVADWDLSAVTSLPMRLFCLRQSYRLQTAPVHGKSHRSSVLPYINLSEN